MLPTKIIMPTGIDYSFLKCHLSYGFRLMEFRQVIQDSDDAIYENIGPTNKICFTQGEYATVRVVEQGNYHVILNSITW